ncbi:hypothetical protein G6M50_09935 [Agrobacterium rhizogenes]|nr:hypothetical protein [Rhizobium rhizogenes]NTJ78112.1 hypothetical protein [Rhizobium rhizogenes]
MVLVVRHKLQHLLDCRRLRGLGDDADHPENAIGNNLWIGRHQNDGDAELAGQKLPDARPGRTIYEVDVDKGKIRMRCQAFCAIEAVGYSGCHISQIVYHMLEIDCDERIILNNQHALHFSLAPTLYRRFAALYAPPRDRHRYARLTIRPKQ